jgi:Bifunctional DNA primase/polymerase, N-terminal
MFQDGYCHDVLTAALALTSTGLAVFPCVYRQKEPGTKHGFYDATTNPATVKRWFGGNFRRNLAVRTGLASDAWVLDADDLESLTALENQYGRLPVTRQSQTARGFHFWFRPAGIPIPSSTSHVAIGIDVKAQGGYVIVAPSIHPDGPTYRWLNEAPILEAPEWLIALARKPVPPQEPALLPNASQSSSGPPGAYGVAALRKEIEALVNTAPGGRNHRLNRSSFCLYQLVAGEELKADDVDQALIKACEANGLMAEDGMRQCVATIRSGAVAGMKYPRKRPKLIVFDGGGA